MWTGNYNWDTSRRRRSGTLAGSMWTGNYNLPLECKQFLLTLAGSMWTGNYNTAGIDALTMAL